MYSAIRKTGRFFRKSLSLVLAFSMMISVCLVSGFSLTVSAATSLAGRTIYLDISSNSEWQGKIVTASFDSGSPVTFVSSGKENQLKAVVPSDVTSANTMTLKAYASDYPMELTKNLADGKYRIITKKYYSSSENKDRDYIYAYNSSTDRLTDWDNKPKMTAYGNYYYYDVDKAYEHCIFATSGTSQSADLDVVYDSNRVAYFDNTTFKTVSSAAANISTMSASQNLFYLDASGNISISKYSYDGTNISATTKTVYLYNKSWTYAYVTYDLSDAYQVTVPMTDVTNENDVTYFYASVPVDATFRFQPNLSNTIGASSNLKMQSDAQPLYIMDSASYWTTFDNLPTQSSRIPNTFDSTKVYGVKATYFDYLSDNELTSGYLNNSNATLEAAWEPFKTLDSALDTYTQNNHWRYPLYFGNFNGKSDGYNGYTNFYNAINNSAGLGGYWKSIMGLTSNSLSNNKLTAATTNGQITDVPLFNASWLKNGTDKELAKVFDSYFPFTYTTDANGITTYSFDSSGGGKRNSDGTVSNQSKSNSDNVYFTWDGDTPVAVNYGKGSSYAVTDGGSQFGLSDTVGFGIYPFNNTSATKSQTLTDSKVSVGDTITVPDGEIWISTSYSEVAIHAWSDTSKYSDSPAALKNKYGYFVVDSSIISNYPNFILTSAAGSWTNQTANLAFSDYQTGKAYTYSGDSLSTMPLASINAKSNTYSQSRGGNDALDYGFGIRLDIDFRVPEGGFLKKGETITVPENEIWISSDYGTVAFYGYGNGNTGSPAALSKNSYGYYVINYNDYSSYPYFILTSANGGWSNQYPAEGTNLNLSDYKGKMWKYSASGITGGNSTISTSSDPVTFDFSGDDDLWVYISDDEGNSQLVLDLGGDHKFSSGTIDFSTMTATSDFVYNDFNSDTTEKVAVPSDEIWIKKDSYSNLYFKTWNKTDSSGNPVDTYISPYATVSYKMKDGNSVDFFKFKASALSGASQFTINTAKTTSSEICTLNSVGATGNVYNIVNSKAELYTYTSTAGTSSDSVSKSFYGGQTLDPNKTYHMTVFYMERGLIESNFQVHFTMTPVTNNLEVDKEVVADGINNSTLAQAVYDNDTFSYYSSNTSESVSGKTYTYTDQSGNTSTRTLDSNGSFSLKDKESAYFVSRFETGSTMTVNESGIESNPAVSLADRYSTNWALFDSAKGTQLGLGSSTKAEFTLEGTNTDENAELLLHYVNTLNTGTLVLKKQVFDKENKNITSSIDRDFSYTVKVDVNGGTDYKAYPLNYTVTSGSTTTDIYSADGTISFSPGDTVTINGLPVGSTYMVTENVPEGYRCSNNNISGTITSTVSTAEFHNIQSDGQGEITVTKTLDGKNYTGSQFEFVLEGLDASSVTNGVDMSGKATSTKSADKGTVTFKGGDALTFSEVGVYRFRLYEKRFDKIGYTTDSSTYYLQFTVTDNGGELEINSNTVAYYTNDSFSGDSVTSVTFRNTTEKALITVNKSDQSNSTTNTDGTKFALVKVKSANLSEDQIENIIKNDSDKITVQTITNGSAVFSDLPIYRNGDSIYDPASSSWVVSENYLNGTSTTQIYCIFEYSPAGGYSVNNTVNYVTFPLNTEYVSTAPDGYTENDDGYYVNDDGNYKYSTEFSYVDGLIVSPNASGSGMNMFLIIGLGILGTGVPAVVGYMLYDRNQRKKRRARYNARH